MAYHVVDPDDLELTEDYPCDRRSITDAFDLDQLNAAIYDLTPGEDLSRHYHYHEHREEVFYVISGELHVETPERDCAVPEGHLFVVEPDSPIRPHNPADASDDVRVLGTGAPLYDVGREYDP